jgi:hypothetical protein
LLPQLQALIVDQGIGDEALVGFNAAHLERSIILKGGDSLLLAQATTVTSIAEPE